MLALSLLAVAVRAGAAAQPLSSAPGAAGVQQAQGPGLAPLLWPLPRSMGAAGTTGTLDPATFEFKATGKSSSTLSSAFERYAKLLAADGAGARAGAGAGAVALVGLEVDVASDSLALGVDTSEAYNLTVTFPHATLSADTVYGALRGLETFSQLLRTEGTDHTIAAQTVVDFPRFPHRGVMLDTARHFLPVSFLVGFLEAMSYSKLNVLHLHLTDAQSFPVESTAFPKLTDAAFKLSNGCRSLANPMPNESHVWNGKIPKGWHRQPQEEPLTNCTYSHDDLRYVVEHARLRGIRVVPEFDMPAHASSWGVGYPDTTIFCGCTEQPCPPGSTDPRTGKPSHYSDVLNPVSNKSFAVVSGFFTEMASIFTDKQMHIGVDEVLWSCLNRSAEVTDFILGHGKKLDDDGYKFAIRYYIKRVQTFLASLGKKTSVWQEALGKYGPGNHGGPFDMDHYVSINHELLPGTTVEFWLGATWYQTDADCMDRPADEKECGGKPVVSNLTDALVNGHYGLNMEPYLGESSTWPGGYTSDPATNRTCTYPQGVDGPKSSWNCTCMEEGNQTATGAHAVVGAGGCFDYADDDPLFKNIHGGEACMWGEGKNASNIHLVAWPGALSLAERLWSSRELNDVEAATPRVMAQMDRLRGRGVPVRPDADWVVKNGS